MSSRQKRKRKRRAAGAGAAPAARAPSRSEQKNEAARAALVPLEHGERPTAVTVGAIVIALNGVATIGVYAAGVEFENRPQFLPVISYSCLMFAAAWGMWRARYWAVLGFQALLALTILTFFVFLVYAPTVWLALLELAVILAAGTLFWFMVKAMARIQMPTRDQ